MPTRGADFTVKADPQDLGAALGLGTGTSYRLFNCGDVLYFANGATKPTPRFDRGVSYLMPGESVGFELTDGDPLWVWGAVDSQNGLAVDDG